MKIRDILQLDIAPLPRLVLVAVKEEPGLNRQQLSEFLGCEPSAVTRAAQKLREAGYLRIHKTGKTNSIRYEVV